LARGGVVAAAVRFLRRGGLLRRAGNRCRRLAWPRLGSGPAPIMALGLHLGRPKARI
jgi:hypothetical protein